MAAFAVYTAHLEAPLQVAANKQEGRRRLDARHARRSDGGLLVRAQAEE